MHQFRLPCTLFFSFLILSLASCKNESSIKMEDEGKLSKQDRIDKAMAQEFQMTQDPVAGYVPRERLWQAQQYMRTLGGGSASREAALAWQERGPNNVAGRTRALFVDSRDATGNTVFAASVSGGIWKCTNFKTTPVWTPVFEAMGNLAVCALVQDKVNPDIMYAGTGEGWFNADAVRGNGIWKSTNGGTTWAQLAFTDSLGTGGSNFNYVQDLVVNNKGYLFATARSGEFCNGGGVFRSINGGTTWTRALGNLTAQKCDSAFNYRGADLEIASNGDLYATTGFQGGLDSNLRGRIYRSSAAAHLDSVGKFGNWQEITPTGRWQRIEIVCAPSDPATLYALLESSDEGIGGIRKSTDFGATWQTLPLPNWCNQGEDSDDFTNGQAWFDLIVSVDPNDKNTVIIGGIDLFKSTNGGTTWNQITQWASGCPGLPNIHADQHNVVFYPGSSTEYISSNDGGLYYSSNSGTSWSQRNGGYNVTQFYAVDYHPLTQNYFLAGAQDNGTQKFTLAGINTTSRVSGGDGAFCHIDQTDGNIQVSAFVYNNYFYSRNGGANFSRLEFNDEGQFINPTDYDDVNDVLYTGYEANKMGVVTGFSGTGEPAFNSVTVSQLNGRQITALKVDPTTSNGTVYIAGYFGGDENSNGSVPNVLKLVNAHTLTPTITTTGNLPVPGGAYISSIDVNPANGQHLLVTLSNFGVNSVFQSTNGGVSWQSIEGNLPDMPVRWGIFAAPGAQLDGPTGGNGGILLATELSVWSTSLVNGASTVWIPNISGMPSSVRTDMLKYRTSDGMVVAATHGRGLFTTTITGGIITSVPNTSITKDFIKYISSATNALQVVTGSLTTRKIQIQVFDAKGSLVYRADQPYQSTRINTAPLSAGTYTIRITGDKKENYMGQFIKQ